MEQKDYLRTILEKLDQNHSATCEDCGKIGMLNHAIVNHEQNRVKIVCHNCFMNRYRELLYSDVKGNA